MKRYIVISLLVLIWALSLSTARAQRITFSFPDRQEPLRVDDPERSELLAHSKDANFILRNFRTMAVDAHAAFYFDDHAMIASLGENGGFRKLGIRLVDDRRLADVVLEVSLSALWDYPFVLRHQNSSTLLVSGKGAGPFSGPLGAADVTRRLTKALKPYRVAENK